MEKFSLTDIKKMNYSDVYHIIYENERSSKQSIAQALKMSLPTVSSHLNDLLKEELIENCGQLSSQIGRKAAAYSIKSKARIAIGVEILKKKVIIVALNLYGSMIERKSLPILFSNADEYYKAIGKEIMDFIGELGVEQKHILGIGFGLQGLVSSDGREIIYGKILNCTGLTIDVFEQYLDIPCRYYHDAECAAISELWETRDITEAIYISIGDHLGGAIIVGGEIHNGRTGRSGTIEHMTLIPDGIDCYCGQKGCMECYCSVNALLEEGEELEVFFLEKSNGDLERKERWDAFLHYLAITINNLHMTLDSSIILGGRIAPYLTEEDLSVLYNEIRTITAFPEDDSFIIRGNSKKDVVAIGAGLPYIRGFLEGI